MENDENFIIFIKLESQFSLKVELNKGNANNPHIIHLLALNSDKPIEDLFYNFINNETDNLNPEGLDFLLLTDNDTKIIFNDIYLSEKN